MTITKKYHFEEYGRITPYWQAEQLIENGLLSFKQVFNEKTREEAITKMLKYIYKTKNLC